MDEAIGVGLIVAVAGLLTWGIYKAFNHFGPAPLPPLKTSPKILASDYLREHYPERTVVKVAGDGGCMPRAAAACVPLFKDDSHWKTLSRAINQFIGENWILIKTKCFISFPLESRVGPGRDLVFQNEVEYLEFLKTNKALNIWRDHHDLIALCEILQVKITVITVKGDYVETVHEVLPVSGAMIDEKDDRMVLLHAGEHYCAVVPER